MAIHRAGRPGLVACLAVLLTLAIPLSAAGAVQAPTQDPPRWEADTWFDHFRPTLAPRELTKAEREEVRALAQKHRAATASWKIPSLITEGQPVGEVRQQATLLRLFELGESGDEEAMLAARAAIYGDGLCGGWGNDAPFRLVIDSTRNCDYANSVALALTGYWTALIWQRHGAERSREAYQGLKSCFLLYQAYPAARGVFRGRNAFVNCGFSMMLSEAALTSRDMKKNGRLYLDVALENYWQKGGKPPLEVNTFYPTVGDADFDRKRFQGLLATYRPSKDPDPLGLVTNWTGTDRAWVEHYAAVNQRDGDVKAMLARVDRQLADEIWQANHRAQQLRAIECDQGFTSLTTTSLQVTDAAVRSLEATCAEAGDAWLEKFAQRFVVVTPANIDRLCGVASSTCTRQRAGQDQRNAAFAAEEKAKRDAANSAFTGKLPPAAVNVRTYDQNGNYIGTETMTRGEAELRGAK